MNNSPFLQLKYCSYVQLLQKKKKNKTHKEKEKSYSIVEKISGSWHAHREKSCLASLKHNHAWHCWFFFFLFGIFFYIYRITNQFSNMKNLPEKFFQKLINNWLYEHSSLQHRQNKLLITISQLKESSEYIQKKRNGIESFIFFKYSNIQWDTVVVQFLL